MRGGVGPGLIEDKITKGIKNGFILINFRFLPDMGVVTVDNIGAGIDHLVGKIGAPFFGLGQIFVAPMDRNNQIINLGVVLPDLRNNF